MVQAQIQDGKQTLAIGNSTISSPEFIETLERQADGYKQQYYMWLSRLFIATTICSMLFLISAALALFRLAPMVTVEPFLIINQDSSDSIVREEPITIDMSSREKLLETFIKQYVILRNTVINDPMEMRSRWMGGGMVNFLSSEAVYAEFATDVKKRWKAMFHQALVREVEVISVLRQGGARSPVWKVDFKTYDLYDAGGSGQEKSESTLRVRYWTASVTAAFIRGRQFMGRRLLNPNGFTVTRYSQTEVDIF